MGAAIVRNSRSRTRSLYSMLWGLSICNKGVDAEHHQSVKYTDEAYLVPVLGSQEQATYR